MTIKRVELPIFHLGTYTSSNGQPVTFTPELLRQMERNTKLVIRMSKFQPPVGYDHPAARDTNAHGFISDVRYDNGKLIATLEGTSDKLRDDAKSFRRLTYSPEFHEDYSFVHDGKPVKVGPTVIGLAMLGAQRGAIKNTAMVPLSEVPFGEAVSEVEALVLREDLRAMGYVGEYVVDGKFFGEVENDTSRFFEERQEPHMTDAEIKALMESTAKAAVDAATAPLMLTIKEQNARIESFSETSARTADVKSFCEAVQADKPRLNKLGLDRLNAILMHPAVAKAPDLDKEIRAFVEALSPIVLPGATKEKPGDGGDADKSDEPAALASLKPRMFSDITAHEAAIAAGITAFGEFKPDAFKGIEANQSAQIERVKAYVRQRDIGDA